MIQHLDPLRLQALAEGQLPEADRGRALEHLAVCAACRARAAAWERESLWLAHLPAESAPAGLAARITATVEARGRAARRGAGIWRKLALASLVCALAGLALVALAWSDAQTALAAAAANPGGSVPALQALLDLPLETAAGLAGSALSWGAGLTEAAGAMLLAGLTLLTAAAFGGLAQLLRPALGDGLLA